MIGSVGATVVSLGPLVVSPGFAPPEVPVLAIGSIGIVVVAILWDRLSGRR